MNLTDLPCSPEHKFIRNIYQITFSNFILKTCNLSIHPSIVFRLSGVRSRGQQPKQRHPDFPRPSHLGQLIWGESQGVLRPAEKHSPSNVSWVFLWASALCPGHLTREVSRRHPNQIPKPPQLAPLDVEKQRLYSESLPDDQASYPISKGEPRHPTEETHFGRLYP
ncbi:hypothetical protein GOODEAATRI_015637 [Goodea atripinnis]|uniref:Uncharacterized protein n=1 Tax=Goodea atripinnis TaxID=208336 RepID=A0ABV0NKJ3_9TELE